MTSPIVASFHLIYALRLAIIRNSTSGAYSETRAADLRDDETFGRLESLGVRCALGFIVEQRHLAEDLLGPGDGKHDLAAALIDSPDLHLAVPDHVRVRSRVTFAKEVRAAGKGAGAYAGPQYLEIVGAYAFE